MSAEEPPDEERRYNESDPCPPADPHPLARLRFWARRPGLSPLTPTLDSTLLVGTLRSRFDSSARVRRHAIFTEFELDAEAAFEGRVQAREIVNHASKMRYPSSDREGPQVPGIRDLPVAEGGCLKLCQRLRRYPPTLADATDAEIQCFQRWPTPTDATEALVRQVL